MATAGSYYADAENGGHVDRPSADALAQLISGLDRQGNTFVTLMPDSDDPVWYASVSLLADGVFEVERQDTGTGEHQVTTATDRQAIADDLTNWVTSRTEF